MGKLLRVPKRIEDIFRQPGKVPVGTLFILMLLGISACTYGPETLSAQIMNAQFQPGTHRIAVAVHYEKYRPPTGALNTFPNGGVRKILEREARIYICDTDTRSVQKLASLKPSPELKNGFRPWIVGWNKEAVVLKLTGREGTTLADYEKGLNEEMYRIDLQGTVTPLAETPEIFPHNLKGAKPHSRLFTSFDTIEVGPLDNVLFRIDSVTGELVASGFRRKA